MMEIWKDIPGYEGYYQVSNIGRVRNSEQGHLLQPNKKRTGYIQVTLSRQGIARTYRLHRIVAQTFIPNLGNKPYINHKNGDKSNNRVENLEWCTPSENQRHRYDVLLKRQTSNRPVVCTTTGETYPSARAAAKALSLHHTAISMCCHGVRTHTKNLYFKFKGD